MIDILKRQNKSFLNEVSKSALDISTISPVKYGDVSAFAEASFISMAPETKNIARIQELELRIQELEGELSLKQ